MHIQVGVGDSGNHGVAISKTIRAQECKWWLHMYRQADTQQRQDTIKGGNIIQFFYPYVKFVSYRLVLLFVLALV